MKIGAVSYTHLDVYKRQLVIYLQQIKETAIEKGLHLNVTLYFKILYTFVPVSYTHLLQLVLC